MARDPFNDIPEDIEDGDFLDESINGEMPDIDLNEPEQDSTPAAEVTKGTPAKDIFGKLMKLVIPVFAVAGAIWFFIPQEIGKPKDNTETEINEQVQEANTNSLIKDLQEQSEARRKQQEADAATEQEAAILQASSAGAARMPSIPNVSKDGSLTGSDGGAGNEAAIREGEIRASNLEASGSFRLVPSAGDAFSTSQQAAAATTAGTHPSTLQKALAEHERSSLAAQLESASADAVSTVKKDPNESFMARQGKNSIEPEFQKPAFAHNVVQQGTVVRTVLVTGVNSDLPGSVTAIVTSDVYDSTDGHSLMIPKGSRLIGQYNSNVAVGQDRVLMAMTRMILPDGTWISLAGTPGADPIGQSGVEAEVDNHFLRMFGAAFIIGAVSLLLPDDQNTISTDNIQGTGDISAGSVMAIALAETVQTLMQRNRHIAPTLTIKPGTPFMFLVAKDMVMDPYQRL